MQIEQTLREKEKQIQRYQQTNQKTGDIIRRNKQKILELGERIHHFEKLIQNLKDSNGTLKESLRDTNSKIEVLEREGRELDAIRARGEEYEKQLLDTAKKDLADKMQSMLQEIQSERDSPDKMVKRIKNESD